MLKSLPEFRLLGFGQKEEYSLQWLKLIQLLPVRVSRAYRTLFLGKKYPAYLRIWKVVQRLSPNWAFLTNASGFLGNGGGMEFLSS